MQNTTGVEVSSRHIHVAILIPVFNDWASLARLLQEIDAALAMANMQGSVMIIDDGSTLAPTDEVRHQSYRNLRAVELLRLRCNLGHQRAIAVGMAHFTKSRLSADAVVVMDGDGEDRPEDIPRLFAELSKSGDQGHCDVVFAARAKRFESPIFRLMYSLYRAVHWSLTGISVRVGNFSALRPSALPRLLIAPDAWNHYAASVFRSRLPFSTVPLPRGRRYFGESHMAYSSLVAHGLSAIAVYGEIVGARLIMLLSGVVVLAVVLLAAAVFVRLLTNMAIPGWATNTAGLLIIVTMQAILSLLVLALIVLGDRSHAKIIPWRDAELFVDSVERLFER
jgi:glycosyltransferase involved in cell wall biosynthesis